MTPIFYIALILTLCAVLFMVGAWLVDGYNIDKEKIEIDRQAALDIAFKIAKQTEDRKNN